MIPSPKEYDSNGLGVIQTIGVGRGPIIFGEMLNKKNAPYPC